ncbi:hypothetical protein EVAR_94632_1 [Eumeta japonica]|uniref:Uncharacterized protein n=1 Tax=Eumeta variegata TaxID=151549 RepID=A0A4C1UUX8_EUMVA|nr:hypothetical protein EVAR_94632_1 [Eumeta japonica]
MISWLVSLKKKLVKCEPRIRYFDMFFACKSTEGWCTAPPMIIRNLKGSLVRCRPLGRATRLPSKNSLIVANRTNLRLHNFQISNAAIDSHRQDESIKPATHYRCIELKCGARRPAPLCAAGDANCIR